MYNWWFYKAYVDDCVRRLYENVKDHNGHNHSSYLVKDAGKTGHLLLDTANFEVTGSGYCTMHAVGKLQKPFL